MVASDGLRISLPFPERTLGSGLVTSCHSDDRRSVSTSLGKRSGDSTASLPLRQTIYYAGACPTSGG